jgi:hypothetical protein
MWLLWNKWLFALVGNVLLVAGHDPFSIIQCSVHIFPPGLSFLLKCLRAFALCKEGPVLCRGSFYIHHRQKTINRKEWQLHPHFSFVFLKSFP